jgi:hypothetical protein
MRALPAVLAGHAVGLLEAGRAYSPILPTFIAGFQSLSAQIDQCPAHIQCHLAETHQPLTSIRGVGPGQAVEMVVGDSIPKLAI